MKNFEYLKSLDSEYTFTDIIMYFLSTHYSEVIKSDGTIEGLPLLHWLQKERVEVNKHESNT